ncbi:MAG: hypothetical protein HY515_02435 [Candidatus Aenigmarchaeota archaeon]|nr:hypothetical protein [Candidatus Aenigmarchaeota archaeon]
MSAAWRIKDDPWIIRKESQWQRVLYRLFINASNASYFSQGKIGFYDDKHPIAEELGIKGQELGSILHFLSEQKLIEGYLDGQPHIIITAEGFDVASEIGKAHENMLLQGALFVFAAISALTSIWTNMKSPNPTWTDYGMVIGILSILVLYKIWNNKQHL